MQGAFISALTYQPPVVLGRQLLHFSPWHGLMLEAAGSPYLVEGKTTVADMIYGVWVCSTSFSEGYAKAGDGIGASKWGKKEKRSDRTEAKALFDEYIIKSFACPDYWSTGGGAQLKAPYWWHLALFGQNVLGLSEAKAWDHPIMKLVCYRACDAESNGWDKLKTENEMEGSRVLRADMEKEEADKNNNAARKTRMK